MQGNAPRTVIVVTVKESYIQCSRALSCSGLWNPAKFDEEAKARVPVTLY